MTQRTAAIALITSTRAFSTARAFLTHARLWRLAALAGLILLAFVAGRVTIPVAPEVQQAVAEMQLEILLQQRSVDRMLKDNQGSIDALSAQLASLQAASTRIDALGSRLAQMGQLAVDEFDFAEPVALGGPLDSATMAPASERELRNSIDWLGEKLRRQSSQLDALQSLMANRQFEDSITPNGWPVRKGYISSRFGERTDPFTGKRTRHHGLDFVGARGSDVLSVAGGVVVWAGNRSGYGKTIEIDHGNGYRTLYAHNQELDVQAGEQVSAGQVIGKLGSTGRASAPHVHFEVLHDGSLVNPSSLVGKLR